MTAQRTYLAIDLKSFYALVECVDRGLDSLTTNLGSQIITETVKLFAKIFSPFSALRGYDEQLEDERERTEWAVTESDRGVEPNET